MTKESVRPCLREGKVLMEFEKGGIEVILGGVRTITPIKPVGTVGAIVPIVPITDVRAVMAVGAIRAEWLGAVGAIMPVGAEVRYSG